MNSIERLQTYSSEEIGDQKNKYITGPEIQKSRNPDTQTHKDVEKTIAYHHV